MAVQIHSYDRKLWFPSLVLVFSEQIEVFNNGRLSSLDDRGLTFFWVLNFGNSFN